MVPARRLKPLVGCLLSTLLCFTPLPAAAQAIYGTVTGQVEDDSGAAVPGATVQLANEATGLQLDGVSDENGTYTIRNVTAGPYTLRASLQGFKEFVQTGRVLRGDLATRLRWHARRGARPAARGAGEVLLPQRAAVDWRAVAGPRHPARLPGVAVRSLLPIRAAGGADGASRRPFARAGRPRPSCWRTTRRRSSPDRGSRG